MAKGKHQRVIEERRVEDLVPYARNARTHTDGQVAKLLALILEFGWTNPVLADSQGIAAGHCRVLASPCRRTTTLPPHSKERARTTTGLMTAGKPFTETPAANDERRLGSVA